jgi:hypothetical protein
MLRERNEKLRAINISGLTSDQTASTTGQLNKILSPSAAGAAPQIYNFGLVKDSTSHPNLTQRDIGNASMSSHAFFCDKQIKNIATERTFNSTFTSRRSLIPDKQQHSRTHYLATGD